jgi:hypothetical protein
MLFVQLHPQLNRSFPQTFEGLWDAMAALPGMVFEMDGSFVWVDHTCTPSKQMDAMVYDHGGSLAYIEVTGDISASQWFYLCRCVCNQPVTPLKESDYAMIDTVVRIHLTTDGCWTTPSAIAWNLH